MSFSEAVKSGFDHYVKFDGRASRPAYWWWFLFVILVGIASGILDAIIFNGSSVLNILVSLGLILPNLSVSIRRLHDTDRSGWWVLIGLIPIIGFIVLLVFFLQKSDPGDNSYGSPMAAGIPAA